VVQIKGGEGQDKEIKLVGKGKPRITKKMRDEGSKDKRGSLDLIISTPYLKGRNGYDSGREDLAGKETALSRRFREAEHQRGVLEGEKKKEERFSSA